MLKPPYSSLLDELMTRGHQARFPATLCAALAQRFVSELPGRPGSEVAAITLFGKLGFTAAGRPWMASNGDTVLVYVQLTSGRAVVGHLQVTPEARRLGPLPWDAATAHAVATALASQPRDCVRPLRPLGELHRGAYGSLRRENQEAIAATIRHFIADLVPADGLSRRIGATLTACERTARERFERRLDAALLASCPKKDLDVRLAGYNFLMMRAPDVRPLYVQAFRAYPFLWASAFAHDEPAVAELRAAIEDRKPIAEIVLALLDAKPWQVDRLRRAVARGVLTFDLLRDHDALLRLVRGLDHLKPEQVPNCAEGWRYFARAVESLRHKSWLNTLAAVGFDALGTNCNVPAAWHHWAQIGGLRAELAAVADFWDYTQHCPDQQLLPPGDEADLSRTRTAVEHWRATAGPEVLSYYYDRALPAHLRQNLPPPWAPAAADASACRASQTWAPLITEPVVIDGYAFTELASAAALRLEGYQMRHCVGDYAAQCASGSHIFSVRRLEGKGRSTLQLECAGPWMIIQHSGKANSAPGEDLVRVAEAFVVQLNRAPAH